MMNKKNDYKKFKVEIENRGIEYLIHFTPTINLYSILEQKEILCRAKLESLDIEKYDVMDFVKFTDDNRFDDTNYINLSISGPNDFLFSKFREKTLEDPTISWCILKIDSKYIYAKDTLFSVTNAASNTAKKQYGISGDFEKFQAMFQNQINIDSNNSSRFVTRKQTKDMFTTDPQAEVLVKNSISTDDILKICFETQEQLANAMAAMSSFDTGNFLVDKDIFSPIRSK